MKSYIILLFTKRYCGNEIKQD